MVLSDYESFAKKPLVFPIRGKKYVLHPVDIEAGLKLSGVVTGADKAFARKRPQDLWKLVLGSAYDDMVADKVPLDAMTRAGVTALAEFQYGREAAEAMWEAGADPEALAAYMEKAASQGSNNTGAAKKTRSRVSTSGTNSRKK